MKQNKIGIFIWNQESKSKNFWYPFNNYYIGNNLYLECRFIGEKTFPAKGYIMHYDYCIIDKNIPVQYLECLIPMLLNSKKIYIE